MSNVELVIAKAIDGVRGLTPYQPGKPIEELQRELGLNEIIKLASNESPIGPSPLALAAAQKALADIERYPDGSGFLLKARLAEKLHAVCSNITPAHITLGNGSNDVLDLVARAFAGPGSEVVYSQHAFVVYPIAAKSVGAKGVVVPAIDYGHDLDAMAAAINRDTRIVYIANPNNPTGTWVDADALHEFLSKVPKDVVVVVDEAYCEYIERADYPDCVAWVEEFSNLVVTRTFSKVYGLAGMRVGYSVSDPAVADLLNRVRQPFNVNAISLAAAEAALDDEQHVARSIEINNEGMRYLESQFARQQLPYIPSIGNFISFQLPADAAPIYQALLHEGVIVRPVAGYEMPHHLRVSIGLPQENEIFIKALERVLSR